MKRFGSATWSGGLREGKGSVSTERRALETYPYTFFSRYGEKQTSAPPVRCNLIAVVYCHHLGAHVTDTEP